MKIKVLVVDDKKVVRDCLRLLIQGEGDMEVVGEAESGRAAVELARDLYPDVVVMDISMPDLDGIEATRQILAEDPEAKVITLSMHSDPRFVAAMLDAGALAYVSKDQAFNELAFTIRKVVAGRACSNPRVSSVAE